MVLSFDWHPGEGQASGNKRPGICVITIQRDSLNIQFTSGPPRLAEGSYMSHHN